MKPIQLNGQDGGGQMLRTALSLALITGQPFRMTNIRGQRRKPGLMRQHLTCVKAAAEISQGIADGADLGSTELVFRADKVVAGDYEFAIGTAGSTTLLLQTLLPALWLGSEGESSLQLSGGTHNPLAPCYDFIERVFLPAMAKLGPQATMELIETGFAPTGGGTLRCEVESFSKKLKEPSFEKRGDLLESKLQIISREVNDSVAERIFAAAQKEWPDNDTHIEHRNEGPGQGLVALAEVSFEGGREIVAGYGERSVSSEKIGHRMGKSMKTFLDSGVIVGRHLADQLLLPMALAGGGTFLTTAPDNHVPTNISVIEKFIAVTFSVSDEGQGIFRVSCQS